MKYSSEERKVVEGVRDWARQRGMGFIATMRLERGAAPFPPSDNLLAEVTAAGNAWKRSARNASIVESTKSDLTSDINAFHVMSGQVGDLKVTVEQYGATAGMPALASRNDGQNPNPQMWDTGQMYAVKTAIPWKSPYMACGPARLVKAWATEAKLNLIKLPSGGLTNRRAICAEDPDLARRVFNEQTLAELQQAAGLKGFYLVLKSGHCHVMMEGQPHPAVLDALIDVLPRFYYSLPRSRN